MIEAGKVHGTERKGHLSTDLDHTGAVDLSGEIKQCYIQTAELFNSHRQNR